MLTKLKIEHYALIETLDIDFMSGFSVITGETGAGKSILLGALALICGERADTKIIGQDQQKCIVEATFNDISADLKAFLQSNELDEDDELIIRREVTLTGKSRAFVNDTPVTLATLRQIGSMLIDIHSQHQNLLLREEDFLLDMLDAIAGNAEILKDYKAIFMSYQALKAELVVLREKAESESSEADYLRFQLQQIDAIQLKAEEEKELEEEVEFLSHAEDVKTALFSAQNILQGEEKNAVSQLRQVADLLHEAAHSHAPSAELAERAMSVSIELKDIAGEVDAALENIDYDPTRLAFVNERLQTIYDLKRKHRVETAEELLQLAESLRQRLSLAENADEVIAEKERAVTCMEKELDTLCAQLHSARLKASIAVSEEACAQLQQLGMPHCTMNFEWQDKPRFSANGKDKGTLLFSANKNVQPANVANIASGGEVARLMLTIKTIISRHKQLPTVIFDEIDTGVSGKIAEKMAYAMREMAKHCQVVCITHLPQIAAAGSRHYKVYKEDEGPSTTTHIRLLSQEQRVEELSKMLSGENVTQAAISNAKALLSATDIPTS